MYPPQAPWTGIGSLQQEVADVRREVSSKANSYEIRSIDSRLDRLEHSVQQISSENDSLLTRLQQLEEEMIQIKEPVK